MSLQHVAIQSAAILAAIESIDTMIGRGESAPDLLALALHRNAANAELLWCYARDAGLAQPLRWKLDLAAQHIERAARERARGDAVEVRRRLALADIYLSDARMMAQGEMLCG